jgi:hypothetical protein
MGTQGNAIFSWLLCKGRSAMEGRYDEYTKRARKPVRKKGIPEGEERQGTSMVLRKCVSKVNLKPERPDMFRDSEQIPCHSIYPTLTWEPGKPCTLPLLLCLPVLWLSLAVLLPAFATCLPPASCLPPCLHPLLVSCLPSAFEITPVLVLAFSRLLCRTF